MMPNPTADTDVATPHECSNCAYGGRTVAMLMLRCQSKESPRGGQLVDLDGHCSKWAAKEGER